MTKANEQRDIENGDFVHLIIKYQTVQKIRQKIRWGFVVYITIENRL